MNRKNTLNTYCFKWIQNRLRSIINTWITKPKRSKLKYKFGSNKSKKTGLIYNVYLSLDQFWFLQITQKAWFLRFHRFNMVYRRSIFNDLYFNFNYKQEIWTFLSKGFFTFYSSCDMLYWITTYDHERHDQRRIEPYWTNLTQTRKHDHKEKQLAEVCKKCLAYHVKSNLSSVLESCL